MEQSNCFKNFFFFLYNCQILYNAEICMIVRGNKMDFFAKRFDELNTKELYEILKARSEIFVMEQNIHYQDMDDIDYKSLHCFLADGGKVYAYLRAFYADEACGIVKVGRVLTLRHGNGTGMELMNNSIQAIRQKMNCKKICIDAQKHAVGFYRKFGFEEVSDDFLEEGIVHVRLELEM